MYGSLSGVILQITTRLDGKYEYDIRVKLAKNGTQEEYLLDGGYAVEIFFYLQSLLNFSYVLRSDVNAMKFDKVSAERGSIDLYLASYSLLASRTKYVDPTFVVGQSRISAFMDHSFEVTSSSQNLFLIPFTHGLWLSILVTVVIFMTSSLVFHWFEVDRSMGSSDKLFHCISTTLQKGSDYPFFRNSMRIASTAMSFAVVIVMASYSGIMTSIFAVNRYQINSIEALIKSNYKILIEYGYTQNDSTILIMLQQLSHMTSAVELLKKAEKSGFVFQSFEHAISEVKRAPSSYIIDEETGLSTISELWEGLPCSWDKISVFKLQYPWVMYMKKHTAYRQPINVGLVRIRERGVLNRIKRKWIHLPPQACAGDGDVKRISVSQVQSAFTALFLVMLVICPVIFIVEKCSSALGKPKRPKKNEMLTINTSKSMTEMNAYVFSVYRGYQQ